MEVISPHSETGIAEAVRAAFEARAPLEILGGGTKRGYGHIEPARQLTLSAFSGITAYEPEEMVISMRAGTPLAEVLDTLRTHNQCLAFEPVDWGGLWQAQGAATIGGTIAAAIAGPRRFASGAARDHLLGFSAINGRGEIFKAGGRVVKNVTGYDLPKLAAGSFGTLFVMAELTMRAVPAGQATLGICVEGQQPAEAFALLRTLSQSPLEPTALSYLPEQIARASFGRDGSLTLARFEGGAEGVAARVTEALRICGVGARRVEDEALVPMFDTINRIAPLFDAGSDLWRVSLPPTNAAAAVSALSPQSYVADWAGGLLWVQLDQGHDPVAIHACARQLGGHARHVRRSVAHTASDVIFTPQDPATQQLTARLKDAFDPAHILNRRRMYGDQ